MEEMFPNNNHDWAAPFLGAEPMFQVGRERPGGFGGFHFEMLVFGGTPEGAILGAPNRDSMACDSVINLTPPPPPLQKLASILDSFERF